MVHDGNTAPGYAKGLVLLAMMASTAWAANAFRPTERLADLKPRIELERQIPKRFGEWIEDTSLLPILPNPEVQAQLNVLYSATLARTYRNATGDRVMLSIAYGSDQGSEATAVHRPEFCYSAQGFSVTDLGVSEATIGQRQLKVKHLVGVVGNRREPITYWITLDEKFRMVFCFACHPLDETMQKTSNCRTSS
jgi:EpsI family protein